MVLGGYEGWLDGPSVGLEVGPSDGGDVIDMVGRMEGASVGTLVVAFWSSRIVGAYDGAGEGTLDGRSDGFKDGVDVGLVVGAVDGVIDG
jgi:hypothetical protein